MDRLVNDVKDSAKKTRAMMPPGSIKSFEAEVRAEIAKESGRTVQILSPEDIKSILAFIHASAVLAASGATPATYEKGDDEGCEVVAEIEPTGITAQVGDAEEGK
jgi:hypothetical protein